MQGRIETAIWAQIFVSCGMAGELLSGCQHYEGFVRWTKKQTRLDIVVRPCTISPDMVRIRRAASILLVIQMSRRREVL
jgi:hypothetical protein